MGHEINNDEVVRGGGYAVFHSFTKKKQDVGLKTRAIACECT